MGRVRESLRSPLGVVAVLAVISIVALAGLTLIEDDYYGLPIPGPSGIAPAFIGDEPVWVIDSETGLIVVSAQSTHRAENEMAWCPSARTIRDLTHGSVWDEYGRYIAGPAPRDLSVWTPSMVDGEVSWVENVPAGRSSAVPSGPPCSLTDGFQSFVRFEEIERDWSRSLLVASSLVFLIAIGGIVFGSANRDAAPSRW